MPATTSFDRLPAWAISLSLFVMLAGAAVVGDWLGVVNRRRSVGAGGGLTRASQEELTSSVSTVVAATLGLFAFMLAFTFGEAADRYESRRLLVIKDANAIGTAYLRAEMLPEPEAQETRRLLRIYVDVRANAGNGARRVEASLPVVDALHQALWAQAKTAAAKSPTAVTAVFIQSLNELIDIHGERVGVTLVNRVPSAIWGALIALGILSMVLTGYQRGLADPGPRVGIALLALAFSIILALNVQIDRPFEGLAVSQAAMENLRRTMTP